jgi:hypothetical protein
MQHGFQMRDAARPTVSICAKSYRVGCASDSLEEPLRRNRHNSMDELNTRSFPINGHTQSASARLKSASNGRSTVRDLAKSGQHNQAMHRTIYRTRSRQRTTQDSAQLHEAGCAMGYRTVRREPNR